MDIGVRHHVNRNRIRRSERTTPETAVVVSAGLVVGLFLGQIAVGAPTTIPDWLMVVALGLSTTVVAWETIRRKTMSNL